MASLLLDTHFLLDLIGASSAPLDEAHARLLADPDVTLSASVASIWEIAIKYRLGKLTLSTPLADLPAVFLDLDVSLLTIDERHVLAAPDPEPATRDPFDRLLLAQCAVEGKRLLTVDRALATHPLAWRAA
jgi:PIN domain nuclease of toxin-antitoxin system